MKKKIVLAYSGGLDTTVIIPWLKENYDCEIVAVCVDVGQEADWELIKRRALGTGAAACYVADVRKEYVEDFVWPALKANALYEDKYLLGTSTARPLIAKTLVEYARREGAAAIAHGATGKGNDQVRFDLGIMAFAPDLEIIAPWRIWDLKSREEEIAYLEERGIPVPMKKSDSYSRDDNLWHISHEGLELEDPANEPELDRMLKMTVPPERAPDRPEYVDIEFEQGIPVALDGKKHRGISLIQALNRLGGAHGVGLVDLVENRVVGMKSRGVYETPGGSILYYAHQELEHICLDRQTYAFKQLVAQKMGELIYGGLWFTPLRESLSAFVDSTQTTVSGLVRVKLYKGSISAAGVSSPYSLYNASIASFTTGELYDHADARGFIRLYGLPLLVRALMEQGGEAEIAPLPAPREPAPPPPKVKGKRGRKPKSVKAVLAAETAEAPAAQVILIKGPPREAAADEALEDDEAPISADAETGEDEAAAAQPRPRAARAAVKAAPRKAPPTRAAAPEPELGMEPPEAAPAKRGRGRPKGSGTGTTRKTAAPRAKAKETAPLFDEPPAPAPKRRGRKPKGS